MANKRKLEEETIYDETEQTWTYTGDFIAGEDPGRVVGDKVSTFSFIEGDKVRTEIGSRLRPTGRCYPGEGETYGLGDKHEESVRNALGNYIKTVM